MKPEHLSKVNEPIKALRHSMSLAVMNNNWIEFSEYSEFLNDLIGKVSDTSISPNRSTILRSLFDIVNQISILLLSKGECKQFSEFSDKMVNRYYGRKRENEVGDAVAYLAGDIVINRYINAIYDETNNMKTEGSDDLFKHIKRLDCLKQLHFLFTKNGNPSAFQAIMSYIFDVITNNVIITNIQKQQILRDSVKESFRITERDLYKPPYGLDRDQVLDSYIYDWTSILRQFYVEKDKTTIELVFSFVPSTTIGNDIKENYLYPCLAINLAVIDVTYPQLGENAKGSLLNFIISGRYTKHNGIYHYISSQQFLRKEYLLMRSYLSMVRLVEVWNQKLGRLTTFDYSPEIFLILVCAFIYKPSNYREILKWTVIDGRPRCDRFSEIIDEIEESISKYPNNESGTQIERIFLSFTNVFESARHLLENEAARIITYLDELKKEAISILQNT